MKEEAREHLPAILNVIFAAVVSVVSLLPWGHFAMRMETAKQIGLILVLIGMGLILWAIVHIRRGFYGTILPVTDELVTSGPYHFVRHPAYLGMTIALAGIAVALASAAGLACVVFLFVPSAIWRARREDAALRAKFGAAWETYAARGKRKSDGPDVP
ncbi:MAG: isoprenylcysteine carboxylmethyltransferase family protein [Kiritimatiellae bacterium]|nr:isoprenylcysteine carboxylmethyltransferase family protein [Kiritimatiellia bacterium]